MNIEDLSRDKLLILIKEYNNYIIDFYDTHLDGFPVSINEFFDNEFQEMI